jgi:hypothetical protein
MSTPEDKVKSKVKALLAKYPVYSFMPATGGYGRSGVPDFVCCIKGRFFAIETKAGDNKPTKLQEREIKRIQDCKGAAFVINENNLEVLKEYLDSLVIDDCFTEEK